MTPTPPAARCARRPLQRSTYTLVDLMLAEAGEQAETCATCQQQHWPADVERHVQERLKRA